MPPSTFQGKTLYPFQKQAIDAVDGGRSVIVAAPTGAGKTLVADYAIEHAFMEGRRIVYTAPVKALSNQKFRDFRGLHGDDVGIMTGDVTINPEAPLLIMTTEVFRNTIFESPKRLEEVSFVIFDEVHYIDDKERGTVWEESILYAPSHIRIIALSATIPNIEQLAGWIRKTRGCEIDVVLEKERPVPLHHYLYLRDAGPKELRQLKGVLSKAPNKRRFRGGNYPRHPIEYVCREGWLPALYFAFSRRACERLCERESRRDLLEPHERRDVLKTFDDLAERYEVDGQPGTRRLRHLASRGVLYHHAGILPIHKEIVERLFTTGAVKLLFTTETFALGVNMPAKCVIFDALEKFDGIDFRYMKTRDYLQMAGRAGRQGIDEEGLVLSRIFLDEINYAALKRLLEDEPEPVVSRFNLSYSTILNLYRRLGSEVHTAYDRSFARYQERKQRGNRSSPRNRLIAQRVRVLKKCGYIEDDKLTARGELARKVNGYEIQVAELNHSGVLDSLSAVELASLFVAIVYEARKADDTEPRPLPRIEKETVRLVRSWRKEERRQELPELTKRPDFSLNSVAVAWAKGSSFEDLRRFTSASEGDLVRTFRMALQLMRQLRRVLDKASALRQKLRDAADLLDRDVVDARRQLELG
ncbi:MAG: DEAD/DEAH box helicase [Planctomycetota bacterium]|nr:DEAD/DEAH box helicase [Planctomycetota bacterium]